MDAPLAVYIDMSIAPLLRVIGKRSDFTASTRTNNARKNAASISGGKSVANVPLGGPFAVLGWAHISTVVSELRPLGKVFSCFVFLAFGGGPEGMGWGNSVNCQHFLSLFVNLG
jgi:hypothetical protein